MTDRQNDCKGNDHSLQTLKGPHDTMSFTFYFFKNSILIRIAKVSQTKNFDHKLTACLVIDYG
jgi:hypothetical protein